METASLDDRVEAGEPNVKAKDYFDLNIRAFGDGRVAIAHPGRLDGPAISIYIDVLATAIKVLADKAINGQASQS